jgi:phosphoribosylaminoimidazole (AIR) synthetase
LEHLAEKDADVAQECVGDVEKKYLVQFQKLLVLEEESDVVLAVAESDGVEKNGLS